jgi:hypothetical protein
MVLMMIIMIMDAYLSSFIVFLFEVYLTVDHEAIRNVIWLDDDTKVVIFNIIWLGGAPNYTY